MLAPPVPPCDPALLLAWAARLRECGQVAHEQALALHGHVECRGLSGPAGDALAQLGAAVATRVALVGGHATVAADDLVRVAYQAALAREQPAR